MPALEFQRRVRFFIYMHPRDWYNAGDDAKILLCAAAARTEVYVFGRPGEDARLRSAISESEAAVLLFPDEVALTVDEFLARHRSENVSIEGENVGEEPELSIIVIDGTWNNVRQVLKHFVREIAPDVPHVRLKPETLSVYARTQTRKDGVSSVEAISLLLQELGESPEFAKT